MGRPKAQKNNARSAFEAKITAHDLSTSGFVDLPWAASRAAKGKMVKDSAEQTNAAISENRVVM